MLLEVKNLNIIFNHNPSVRVVSNLSFELEQGRSLGIVGESGSGKSMTALSLMRLLPPSAEIIRGSIKLFQDNKEIDLLQLKENDMLKYRGRIISMVFQDPMTSLNPVLTCGEQVMETILLHTELSKKQASEKVICLFDEVKLTDPFKVFRSYPFQLSGGQRQRVGIAMALSCEPLLLLADEPTTALDVLVQESIFELLMKLRIKYNISIIYISHDLGVISKMTDQVLVMYKGEGVEYGSVDEVMHKSRHPYTIGLLACRPQFNIRPVRLPVIGDFLNKDKETADIPIVTKEERSARQAGLYTREPVMEIKNLKTWFTVKKNFFGKPVEHFTALQHINIDIYRGETIGLVGASGSGKTTLGRTIVRLIEGAEGEIIFKGEDIRKLGKKELRSARKNIQIIFQDPYSSLNTHMTIGEILMEPMIVYRLHGNDRKRKDVVYELLEKVRLSKDSFHHFPHQFSGGQRQRIGIARALAVEPEFIVCDESVSALDVSVQAQILNLLNDIKKEYHLTYLFISHDLSVVRYMSDRIFVMKEGEIIETGEADKVCQEPENAYTRQLLKASQG